MLDPQTTADVLKILVHVAWVDRHVQPSQVDLIRRAGAAANVPADEMAAIEEALQHDPATLRFDLGRLRAQREAVLEAARVMIAIDGTVSDAEESMLEALEHLLDPASDDQ